MKYLTLLLLALTATMAMGQLPPPDTDAMLFGDVKDQETGEHIPFVNIVVQGTTIGTSTDATGHYMFTDLPVGEITVVASALGYKTIRKTISTSKDQSKQIFFSMRVDAIMAEQVVVSADRNEISRKETPVIVSSITPKHLEAIESNSVADGLNYTPGLRVESNCQNCGFTQLRMNGLEGAYSQILVNSRPVFSGLAGVYGLEQIPTEMVERIEVVRGGGSAIFGGNAIAGTVNIITKDPINNTFQVSTKGSAIGIGGKGDAAYSKKLSFNGALVSDNRKAGVFIFGQHKEQDAWDANDDGFSEIVKLENTSVGFQSYYKPNDISRFSLEYHNLSEYRRGGDQLNNLEHTAKIAEMVRHNNNSGGLTYEIFTNKADYDKLAIYASAQHVNRDSYYGANEDPYGYGHTTGLTTVTGAQYVSNIKSFLKTKGTLTMGIENLSDNIYDRKLGADTVQTRTIADQMVNTIGGYTQYQMNFSRVKFLFGFRLDHYRISDEYKKAEPCTGTVFNPRGNILFDLNEKVQFRVSYSTGYRAPQIFDEDLHIEASGIRKIEHTNADDLVAETSQSFSGSVRINESFGRWDAELLIEGFYTDLQNPFVSTLTEEDTITGVTKSIRSNAIGGAKVYGTNLELTLAPSRKFYTQLGGTIQASLYDTPQEWGEDEKNTSKELTRTPGSYAYAIVNYEPSKKLSFSFSGNYTGKMYIPHLAGGNREDGSVIASESLLESENFFVMNLKAAYTTRITKQVNLEIYAGIKNILNSYQSDHDYGVNRDAGFTYGPMLPRTIYLGLKMKM